MLSTENSRLLGLSQIHVAGVIKIKEPLLFRVTTSHADVMPDDLMPHSVEIHLCMELAVLPCAKVVSSKIKKAVSKTR